MDGPNPETIQRIWTLTLGVYAVVLVVVLVMLILILHAARQIRTGVGQIWVVGQKIANNTIHIPLLVKTNEVAGRILASAGGIAAATAAIKTHAETCPGCPACLLGPRWL